MKIAILGYGKEGQSAEAYFRHQDQSQHQNQSQDRHQDQSQNSGQTPKYDITIFDNFTPESIAAEDFSKYDLVLRSPSLRPKAGWSSMTKYFFANCPCPIIGVTGTKGKGTTCSLITTVLAALGQKVWLVGNIGNPALDVLDQIQADDVVVYELSSFQLWDLKQSPHVAVVLGIEPDHLNVHKDYAEYVVAKSHITTYQSASDFCIYNQANSDAAAIATQSAGEKLPYPITSPRPELTKILDLLSIPGQHNRENAEAALLAVAAYLGQPFDHFITENSEILQTALHNFQGLPHRLQFLRDINGIKYYDDNFCTNTASLEVALKAFPQQDIILIAGGRDKTNNADLPEIIQLAKNYAAQTILIGESGREIAKLVSDDERFRLANDLSTAVQLAQKAAREIKTNHSDAHIVVLMSPAAASFDMFENVYDRGAQFQQLVQELQ